MSDTEKDLGVWLDELVAQQEANSKMVVVPKGPEPVAGSTAPDGGSTWATVTKGLRFGRRVGPR